MPFLQALDGSNAGIGRPTKIDVHQDGLRLVECAGLGQFFSVGKGRGPKPEKFQLPDQAACHFLVGQGDVDRGAAELVGRFGTVEVGPAKCALGQRFDGILQLPLKAFVKCRSRFPQVDQFKSSLAGPGMTVHFETLGVAHQFVSSGRELASMGGGLVPVFVNFLPGVQNNPGLGCYTACEMLPEFFFLAFVVHVARACLFFVVDRPSPLWTISSLDSLQSL